MEADCPGRIRLFHGPCLEGCPEAPCTVARSARPEDGIRRGCSGGIFVRTASLAKMREAKVAQNPSRAQRRREAQPGTVFKRPRAPTAPDCELLDQNLAGINTLWQMRDIAGPGMLRKDSTTMFHVATGRERHHHSRDRSTGKGQDAAAPPCGPSCSEGREVYASQGPLSRSTGCASQDRFTLVSSQTRWQNPLASPERAAVNITRGISDRVSMAAAAGTVTPARHCRRAGAPGPPHRRIRLFHGPCLEGCPETVHRSPVRSRSGVFSSESCRSEPVQREAQPGTVFKLMCLRPSRTHPMSCLHVGVAP